MVLWAHGHSNHHQDPLRVRDRDQVRVHRAPVKVGAMSNTYQVDLAGQGSIQIESGKIPGSRLS